ncbi:hypothetical protein EDB80DRAFT_348581 [Ilyonectria destructans]|nr:hypothetical protein EDB80DRAFT_348581 [Ilyonectria destructans]
MDSHALGRPVGKRNKSWSPEENALVVELRGSGMKWKDIVERFPGRTEVSCRLHYQNYLERRSEWDEERKNKLARLYERFKPEMWAKIAKEMAVPWRAAEAMHWQLGEADMAQRANVIPFHLVDGKVDSDDNRHGTPSSRSSTHSVPQDNLTCEMRALSPHTMDSQPQPMSSPTIISPRESISPLATLPGVIGLINGVKPYRAGAATMHMPLPPSQGPFRSNFLGRFRETTGSKRGAPDQLQREFGHRRRVG